MAWPNDIGTITTNMNETELWVLKEQMDTGDWVMKLHSSFAEYSEWEVHIDGAVFTVEEFNECITSVYRQ